MTVLHSFSHPRHGLSLSTSPPSHLQDYETITSVDLFHFSSPDAEFFKDDIHRQRRAEVLQKQRDRNVRNYVFKKLKNRGGANGTWDEEQKIRQKREHRRRQQHDTDSGSDHGNVVKSECKTASCIQGRRLATKASHGSGLSVTSSSEGSDRKSKKHNKKRFNINRSNKRADRHRLPSDEAFSDSSDSETTSEDENDDLDHGPGQCSFTRGVEVLVEHFRFKHNLNFKVDDDEGADDESEGNKSSALGQKLDALEWKRAFERKLDERDQRRVLQITKQQKKITKDSKGNKSLGA
ncbi:hypothetical protein BC939DRAFT_438726 [Gamsiella multidivaricata]|uniref:uncharacterized protein n=1 Tax=Gamsiella multidivaricata TaxID=101098 RepID=UPI00221FD87E|nr:uncharacterized protein BC939DRAFT_438726 [Gamsiella multidivaricata]KAG0365127.1 hypothetical protein BGZ54_006844 [Gamsiella multidivaricata]KAI7830681.1 hypothetical protein BC939DRAFT_438726 [Gamsiella multidivaricata]